jgi:hypothetical protein
MARYVVYFTLLGSFVCFADRAPADEFATPTPTPNFLKPFPGGPLRRAEWVDRRRVLQAGAQSNAQARAQAKANRRSASATQKAESKEAAHARAQAQRDLAAEARHESAKETPHTNSDLMTRMGFSEEEVAAQKAREQSGQLGRKEITNGIIGENHPHQTAAASDNADTRVPSHAATQKPAPSPTTPGPDSR